MEQNTAEEANSSPTERRAWQTPRLTAVTPVDRTMGATGGIQPKEGFGYKTS